MKGPGLFEGIGEAGWPAPKGRSLPESSAKRIPKREKRARGAKSKRKERTEKDSWTRGSGRGEPRIGRGILAYLDPL